MQKKRIMLIVIVLLLSIIIFITMRDNNEHNLNNNYNNISQFEKKFTTISNSYKLILNYSINNIENQFKSSPSIKKYIKNRLDNLNMYTIILNVTKYQIFVFNKQMDNIKTLDNNQIYTSLILQYINKLEEQSQFIITNQKQILKNNKIIKIKENSITNQAYIELKNITYIDQVANEIYNGCESASILMGLKYKGYLLNTTLQDMADNIPLSDDPHTGFVRSIFSKEPNDVPHWIAPDALTKFAAEYSEYQNIFDITGASTDQLKQEIDNGNPVVVYVTYRFRTPTNWIEEMPKNLHVVLLTGYNYITGSYIILDPYGNGRMIIDKNKFETIYNLLGKNAVVIR